MQQNLDDALLLKAAEQFGTPLYIYNADKISEQAKRLKTAFSGFPNRIFYAAKALTNPHILKHIHEEGIGVDCSSINEVKIALSCGIPASDVLYTSNSIAFDEIRDAASLGVHINVDSLSALEKFGQTFGDSYPLGLRIRPDIMAGGNIKISTGHIDSKFGIGYDNLPAILKLTDQYKIRISCLHIHTGSEIKDVQVFLSGVDLLIDWIAHFPYLQHLDLGGGFKVAYKPDDFTTDIEKLGSQLAEKFNTHPNERLREMDFWFEPGKFLVSECGYLLAKVNVLKQTGEMRFAGINSGFHHLLRPMFYDAYHFIRNLSNPGGEIHEYNIVGQICETDNFAWKRPVSAVREGDILAVYNAGAYGIEMASNYNSRLKPAEVLVKDGELKSIRRRETLDDLLTTIAPM